MSEENRKKFPASIQNLYEMMDFVRENARQIGFDPSKISQIELATEEALVNIINYAYPNSPGEVEIVCRTAEPKGFTVVLRDCGVAYNPLGYAKKFDENRPLELRELGGYGIFFILKMMDKVDYERDNDWNVFSLTKYVDSIENAKQA